MVRCARCPVGHGSRCTGGAFCDWARAGDPVHLRHIVAVSLRDAGLPMPAPVAAVPCGAPSIPLAGDLVEALTRRVGADRLAKWAAAKLGADCGCAARRDALNRLDAAARKFLGTGTGTGATRVD